MAATPSGQQFAITSGGHRAVIAEVGATLRSYAIDGVDVVHGFAVEERASGGCGQVLAPWPNRLGGGRYEFGGHDCQAALDEPARGNAIHGLVRWMPWRAVTRSSAAVTMACELPPQPAYAWWIELRVEYRVDVHGLTVTADVVNHSAEQAPFGVGFHPYLTVGTPTVDTASLLIPAQRRLITDDAGLPVSDGAVADTPFDFRDHRDIGPAVLDTAYTDLVRTADGRATVELRAPGDGRRARLWVDAGYRCLMVFTGDTLAGHERRRSIAVEPMTCPPNALRTGTDLITLAPGGSWRASWGVSGTRTLG